MGIFCGLQIRFPRGYPTAAADGVMSRLLFSLFEAFVELFSLRGPMLRTETLKRPFVREDGLLSVVGCVTGGRIW